MIKQFIRIWIIAGVILLLLLSIGIIAPPLISSNQLPAYVIAILLSGFIALIICILFAAIKYIKKK